MQTFLPYPDFAQSTLRLACIMIKYRYSLVKYQFYPREKQLEKVVFIDAIDSIDAGNQIKQRYPEWEVSMFWPVV